jgi:hypothetical protein
VKDNMLDIFGNGRSVEVTLFLGRVPRLGNVSDLQQITVAGAVNRSERGLRVFTASVVVQPSLESGID